MTQNHIGQCKPLSTDGETSSTFPTVFIGSLPVAPLAGPGAAGIGKASLPVNLKVELVPMPPGREVEWRLGLRLLWRFLQDEEVFSQAEGRFLQEEKDFLQDQEDFLQEEEEDAQILARIRGPAISE
jgi:hypothetical protein